MITWADVVLVAPELAKVGSYFVGNTPAQDAILADVFVQLSATSWGTKYDLACKYLAAHNAAVTLRGANGQAGPVIMETVGSISRQYANNSPAGTDPEYSSTPYGKQYVALQRGLVGRIGLVC